MEQPTYPTVPSKLPAMEAPEPARFGGVVGTMESGVEVVVGREMVVVVVEVVLSGGGGVEVVAAVSAPHADATMASATTKRLMRAWTPRIW